MVVVSLVKFYDLDSDVDYVNDNEVKKYEVFSDFLLFRFGCCFGYEYDEM